MCDVLIFLVHFGMLEKGRIMRGLLIFLVPSGVLNRVELCAIP